MSNRTQYWAVETAEGTTQTTIVLEVAEGQTVMQAWDACPKSPITRLVPVPPIPMLAGQALDMLTYTNDPQLKDTIVIEGYFGNNDLWYAIRFHHPQSKVSIGVCNNQSKMVAWINLYTLRDFNTHMSRYQDVTDMIDPETKAKIAHKARMTLGD